MPYSQSQARAAHCKPAQPKPRASSPHHLRCALPRSNSASACAGYQQGVSVLSRAALQTSVSALRIIMPLPGRPQRPAPLTVRAPPCSSSWSMKCAKGLSHVACACLAASRQSRLSRARSPGCSRSWTAASGRRCKCRPRHRPAPARPRTWPQLWRGSWPRWRVSPSRRHPAQVRPYGPSVPRPGHGSYCHPRPGRVAIADCEL